MDKPLWTPWSPLKRKTKFSCSLFETPWYPNSEPKTFWNPREFLSKPLKPYETQWNDLKRLENALKIKLVSEKLLANPRRSLWSTLNLTDSSWNILKRLVALLESPYRSLQRPWNTTKPPLKPPEIVQNRQNRCETPWNPYSFPVGSPEILWRSLTLQYLRCCNLYNAISKARLLNSHLKRPEPPLKPVLAVFNSSESSQGVWKPFGILVFAELFNNFFIEFESSFENDHMSFNKT